MRKIALIMLILPYILFAQTEEKSRYGIFGGFGINMHDADFKRIPDCVSCSPGYKDGSGNGLTFGLVYDYPLFKDYYLSGKISYMDLSGKLISTETTTIISNGSPQAGEFEHSIDVTLSVIGVEPALKITIIDELDFNIGFKLSYLLSKDYSQVERITKPANSATFLDENGNDSKLRERNKFSGTLEKASSLYIAPMLSFSYRLPLNRKKSLFFEPELAYYYGLSNIVSDELVNKWTVNRMNFGLALKYTPRETPEPENIYKKYENIDTIRIVAENIADNSYKMGETLKRIEITRTEEQIVTNEFFKRTDTIYIAKVYQLNAEVSAVGVDENGNEIPNPRIKVEEYISNRLDPLLNYIFFDENSSSIPNRYKQLENNKISEFNITNLFRDSTLEIYQNILNIVADRMSKNPKSNITLIGCNSDFELEKANIALSKSRAESVRDYLVNTWNIDTKRITIQTRNLPQKASTPYEEADKIAENRRVEIYSNDYKILEPIFIEKIDRKANPPYVRFKPSIKSEADVKNWELTAYQSSNIDEKFVEKGNSSPNNSIDWELEKYQKIIPKLAEPLNFTLVVNDSKGNTKKIENQTLKIDVITIQDKRKELVGDYEIERYSLILFDFDKANIEDNNQKIIDFIKSRIKSDSEIQIMGYTDRTGNAEYNQTLSEKRAVATQKALNRADAVAKGLGKDELLYTNDLPEGRFYCRTVNIIVKTKVN